MTHSSNADRPYLVNSQILLGCAEAADELGIDLLPLLRQSGLTPEYFSLLKAIFRTIKS